MLLREGFHVQCVFFCQQAIEVLLKAIWVERESFGMPPKIHGLVELAEGLGLEPSQEQLAFLDDLTNQYMPTRYADVPVEYSRNEAGNYFREAQEFFSWLRPHLS